MTRTRDLGSIGAGALALFSLLVLFGLDGRSQGRQPEIEPTAALSGYVRAYGPFRPFELLLSLDFEYSRPAKQRHRSLNPELLRDKAHQRVLEREVEIQKDYESRPAAATLWAKGILHLCKGHPAQAVLVLEQASQLAPWSAKIANDLAVAYQARAEELGRDSDSYLAWLSLYRALASNPALTAALFNKAVLLDGFNLRTPAYEAWRQLKVEGPPGLRLEIAERCERARQRREEKEWEPLKRQILQSAKDRDDEELLKLVGRFPDKIRDWFALELLPQWAQEFLQRRTRPGLTCLARIAAAHCRLTGDTELPLEIQALEAASDSSLDSVARAYVDFAKARQAYENTELDLTGSLLAQAVPTLKVLGGPSQYWAEFHQAILVYHQPAYQEALRLFEGLEEKVRERGLLGLKGRVQWMVGLCQYRLGSLSEAVTAFATAQGLFERVSERENQAAMHNFVAMTFEQIGLGEEVWDRRVQALHLLRPGFSAKRTQQILRMAAEDFLNQGSPAAAIPFFDESVASGLRSENPLLAAIAFWSRARLRSRLGLTDSAAKDIAAAKEWCGRILDEKMQGGVEIDTAVVEAELLLQDDPAGAVRTLTHALELNRKRENAYRLISVLDGRASAYLRSGDRKAAAVDIRAGIEAFNRQEPSLKDRKQRAAFLDKAGSLFEKSIQMALEDGDSDHAFELVNQARNLPRMLDAARLAAPLADILDHIPEDTLVLDYFFVADKLYLWAVSHGSVNLIQLGVQPTLSEAVASYVGSAETTTPGQQLEAAAQLHSALIAPAEAFLRGKQKLVVVPDGTLLDLPFSSLYDPARKQYLFERVEVRISPGITGGAGTEDGPPRNWTDATLLAIADPELPRSFQPTLPRLPLAQREVSELAELFPGTSQVLSGRQATEKNFKNKARGANLIHLAVHSGARLGFEGLLLAPDANETDGQIGSAELTANQFPVARLVVLSGCSTAKSWGAARGQTFGLAGSLLGAGVPTVVASYWQVTDDGTFLLMKEFYTELLAGNEPAAALRAAKMNVMKRPDAAESTAWMAFEVVQG